MKNKFIRFMQGRYGNDVLNSHLLILAVILSLISIFFKIPYFNFLPLLIIILVYVRIFSKKRYKRAAENRKYLSMIAPIQLRFSRLRHFRTHKYLKCPECKSEMRVPRKKGSIVVTCPKCHARFDAKS